MRTTVTLDDDLAIRLERLSGEQGRSFKAVINDVIRAGLDSLLRVPQPRVGDRAAGHTEPVDLGPPLRQGLPPSALLQLVEDEEAVEGLDVRR